MRNIGLVLCLGLILSVAVIGNSFAEEKVLFSFEDGTTQGFGVAEWALGDDLNALDSVGVSEKYALDGKYSLEAMCTFRGGKWMGAPVELIEDFDWTPYNTASVAIYLPADAPEGLKAQICLNIRGDADWPWYETIPPVALAPGKWTVVTAKMKPGESNFKKDPKTGAAFSAESKQNIAKFYVRVVSDKKPVYQGPVYIDKITLSE